MPSGRYHGGLLLGGEALQSWADWLRVQLDVRRRCVWDLFNNDVGGHAPRDALVLRRHLERAAIEFRAEGTG